MINTSMERLIVYLRWIHIVQGLLFPLIFALGCARAASIGRKVTRADTWIIIVSIKSMVILAYQVFSDKVTWLQRFASLKTNLILNCIETVFWLAALVISGMTVKGCSGSACALSGVIICLAIVLFFLSVPVVAISGKMFHYCRQNGEHPDPKHFSRVPSKDERYAVGV